MKNKKILQRLRRKKSIRKKLSGTADTPRLSVYRSINNIYVQVIDDVTGVTLVDASTKSKDFDLKEGDKKTYAAKVGEVIAMKCKAKGITKVVFDRNGYLYHGRVKALAESARKGGLEF